ncbi:carboxypeptidase-like regulatory domain-containing protein [Pedobacter sp. Leaf250]|uniref:carboxypeptidase-like regulatory domain-containing protein n=1 Tax=Pedobacter sp. Leaf250 TaxID=2876559 RepID=UPI001E2D3A26|nr:carboxypeptidase-like regulatory domain-containing protein [Pedobacter sp. Leaf250]
MKNAQPQISIAEPCNQNWEDMNQKDGFNFCQACNKCVVDFTGYSNAEIIKTLASASSEVCGRLTETQLNQLNYHLVVSPANRSWMKYLGVLAIGVSVFSQNASALTVNPKAKIEISKDKADKFDEKKPITIKKISGRILDENKKPLEGIRVIILNTKYYASTDKNGNYEIKFINGIGIDNKILSVQSARFAGNLTLNYATEKQADLVLKLESMIVGRIMYNPKKG